MNTNAPLVDKVYLLQKTEGKCSWTFVEMPEIPMGKKAFGMMKVRGKIDDLEISNVHLMPMGNGYLGLPIKASIRKKIKKEAPNTVHVTLYECNDAFVIPQELCSCMEYEEGVLEKFESYTEGQQKAFVDWIYSTKNEDTKVDRIAKMILMVQKGEKYY